MSDTNMLGDNLAEQISALLEMDQARLKLAAVEPEVRARLFEGLKVLTGLYIALHPEDRNKGFEKMIDDIFERVAPEVYSGGWPGLNRYVRMRAG